MGRLPFDNKEKFFSQKNSTTSDVYLKKLFLKNGIKEFIDVQLELKKSYQELASLTSARYLTSRIAITEHKNSSASVVIVPIILLGLSIGVLLAFLI